MEKEKRTVDTTRIDTDLGPMIAAATERGICMLQFADCKLLEPEMGQLAASLDARLVEGDNPYFHDLRRQLSEYFRGERREFDIPLDPVGTQFQKEVWLGLLQIPYGCTVSYGKQAGLLGRPAAVRAVGGANGKNKISILIPCHRVIGGDGSLTGYAGGLWRKKWLLELESSNSR